MNSTQRRSIMFGEKAVIEMDIDPFVSNLDTPSDLKIIPTNANSIPSTQNASPKRVKSPRITRSHHADDEKKENDSYKTDEPPTKRRC